MKNCCLLDSEDKEVSNLTQLHSEWPKLHGVFAVLSAMAFATDVLSAIGLTGLTWAWQALQIKELIKFRDCKAVARKTVAYKALKI